MYLEKKKLAQKMGTQHTKLKICLYEKFASLTIVTWTIIVTYTTYYYATIKIQNC